MAVLHLYELHVCCPSFLVYSRERVCIGFSLLIECSILIITKLGYPFSMACTTTHTNVLEPVKVCCGFEECVMSDFFGQSTQLYTATLTPRGVCVPDECCKARKTTLLYGGELSNGLLLMCGMCVIHKAMTSSLGHKRKKA